MKNKDISVIPKGIYCYSGNYYCPYWRIINDRPAQANGWCDYLEKGDIELMLESETYQIDTKTGKKTLVSGKGELPSIPMSLLWDQCKECGINTEEEDDI